MQYWKGEKCLKANQPYQEKDKNKPGPSRKLSHLDEFLLVLMRLKAGHFDRARMIMHVRNIGVSYTM